MNVARVQLRVQAAGPGQHRDVVWGLLWYSVGKGCDFTCQQPI